ncbi:MAG: cryptochrome/photolyase family protein [Schleiferiaceae bacterium]|nr:cryptochrome/photolyase family protein [Schleiferiaceae bacterium]
MSKSIQLIFPHQIIRDVNLLYKDIPVYLIEEHLFFKQYLFHKQKIAFHRASMKAYQQWLSSKGIIVTYIDSQNQLSDIRNFDREIKTKGIEDVHLFDPTDNWLLNRIKKACLGCKLHIAENPIFLNSTEENKRFFNNEKKFFFQTKFYKEQRKRLNLLIEKDQPKGGKWTYDTENRKKYPKGLQPPSINFPAANEHWNEAVDYTLKNFEENPGELNKTRFYPISSKESEVWFEQFLEYRFYDFGIYEDAIVKDELILNHSLLSPLLNTGLLTPSFVINRSIEFSIEHKIPINSTEGFIRQIIGWREFIRGIYEVKGTKERTSNALGFKRRIPISFYDGNTGILPIDMTIKKVLKSGYCHHIERLMALGNFMLLCEFHPDDVYQWFMELFIDAYDWVMVPNVYGMSQFADGGIFATKPYISSSNYIRKMSDYPKGNWESTWDGLYWRFIHQHEDLFLKNPRSSMMVHTLRKMDPSKRENHFNNANNFLATLDAL